MDSNQLIYDSNVLALINELLVEEDMQKYTIYSYWLNQEEEAVIPILRILFNSEHIRQADYYEDWLPQYLERDFFNLFRVTTDTLSNLLTAINCPERQFHGGEQPVLIEKCLLMCLWWLGKGDTLISVSDRFNVALSTVHKSNEFILAKILHLQSRYISWPTPEEAVDVERAFRAKSGYPGVIGAIDGCNVKFKCPNNQQESYIDKNRHHSIKLQGIVSANKIFTNIMVGFPGSAHDSRVLQNCQIFHDVENDRMVKKYFFDDYHLVGDKAYPLKKWLITPYKDTRSNERQIYHNNVHSRTRVVVEHTFGILKTRWRILQYINVNSVEKATKIIAACCIMHNFCYVNNDVWTEFESTSVECVQEDYINTEREGTTKRDIIASNLWRDHTQ